MFQIRTLNVRSLVTSIKCFDLSLKILPLRTFYAEQELGVDSIKRMRQQIFDRFEKRNDVNSHKRNLIKNFSNSSLDKRSDHLKELILLLDKNPDDLNMLKSILVQYQNTTTTSTNNNNDVNNNQQTEFCFGTSLMRMFYLLDFPDGAVELYKDDQTKVLFEQMDAYKVMLTLLHNHKRYEEVFDLYDTIRKRLECCNQYPHPSINCLVFSACYHLNTAKHYEYAKDLYQRINHIRVLIRRPKHLLAGLALKQNDPNVALSLLDNKEYYIGARFIRLMAFMQGNRFDCALAVLRQTIDTCKNHEHGKMNTHPYYGRQVIEDLRKAIIKFGTVEQLNQFNKIYEELDSLNLLDNVTLDQLLCAKFSTKPHKNIDEIFLIDRILA